MRADWRDNLSIKWAGCVYTEESEETTELSNQTALLKYYPVRYTQRRTLLFCGETNDRKQTWS